MSLKLSVFILQIQRDTWATFRKKCYRWDVSVYTSRAVTDGQICMWVTSKPVPSTNCERFAFIMSHPDHGVTGCLRLNPSQPGSQCRA